MFKLIILTLTTYLTTSVLPQSSLSMSNNDLTLEFSQIFKIPPELARRITLTDQIPDIKNELNICQSENKVLKSRVNIIDQHLACVIKNIKKPSLVQECPCGPLDGGCNGKGDCLQLSSTPTPSRPLGTYKCDCKKGFSGQHCEYSECPSGCNLKFGECLNGRCVCKPGYSGIKCNSRTCPNDCTDRQHGRCIKKTGICKCKKGFTGIDCALRRY